MVSILIRKFNAYYAARPVLTTMITNAVLGGIADTVAQTLQAIQYRQAQVANSPSGGQGEGFFGIEFQEFDKSVPWPKDNRQQGPPPFDFERMTRFMSYGFLIAPVQHRWFGFLARTFPLTKGVATGNAMKMVAMDQLIYAPIGLAAFFTFITVAEGGGRRAVIRKFQDVYTPALKANYMVWPLVQMLNFRVMPIQFQIPFVSTIGIAWTAYLSMTNAAEESPSSPASQA